MNSVTIIIVNSNGYHYTRKALEAVFQHTRGCEIIVVDNNSADESRELLPVQFPLVRFLLLHENRSFGAANNAGAAIATGQYLFFLNNDTLLFEDTPSGLASVLSERQSVGICGPKLVNDDGTFQLSFGNDPSILEEWRMRGVLRRIHQREAKVLDRLEREYGAEISVDWLTGAALMIRKDLFHSIGRFDERFFMYFEDVDLCSRVRAKGYEIHYVPTTKVLHFGGRSYANDNEKIMLEYRRSQMRFYKKHRSKLQQLLLRCYLFVKFLLGLTIGVVRPGRPHGFYLRLIRLVLSPTLMH
ncbi:MAG: glycosyltransferase family 2 protein [Candidatus Eisenbacteria bacterium]|nr:glycosyltransferase family 2 protein [Candidatus Eisenbacteria bacterium]